MQRYIFDSDCVINCANKACVSVNPNTEVSHRHVCAIHVALNFCTKSLSRVASKTAQVTDAIIRQANNASCATSNACHSCCVSMEVYAPLNVRGEHELQIDEMSEG